MQDERLGRFTGRDFQRFQAHGPNEDGYGPFMSAVQKAGEPAIAAIAAQLERIAAALKSADQVMGEKAGGSAANLDATFQEMASLKSAVLSFGGGATSAGGGDAATGDATTEVSGGGAGGGGAPSGRIETRADVMRAIVAIGEYYKRREPSSPVPVILARARAWVELDFLSVLADIAPDSLADAKRVLVSETGWPR